jgi:hypothetical protein
MCTGALSPEQEADHSAPTSAKSRKYGSIHPPLICLNEAQGHPYLYLLIFMFLDRRQENKRFWTEL